MPHHADLAQRERHEDADDVELDQHRELRLEDHEDEHGERREGDSYGGGEYSQDVEAVTDAIFARTGTIGEYRTLDAPDLDLSAPGEQTLGAMTVEVVDPVADYAALMERLFDFDAIRALFAGGFTMRFDAMQI